MRRPIVPEEFDPAIHLDPDEAAVRIGPGMPVAREGLAGFAIERATDRMVHVMGEVQWDVLADGPTRRSRSQLPSPTVPGAKVLGEVDAPRWERRPAQVNVRFTVSERERLGAAADVYGLRPATLARLLVNRGTLAIVEEVACAAEPHPKD
jgi:hypothetical protein